MARSTDPNAVVAQDIITVSMLSVNVPARASLWLLEEGSTRVAELLSAIPTGLAIWEDDAQISEGSPADTLWREVQACAPGMGPTLTSKLLAAKRPHLLPVLDSVVQKTLFTGSDVIHDYWELWREELRGPDGEVLRQAVEEVRSEADYDGQTSILRIIDIVVWTLNHPD
jgi:hypothetical protein